jgi:hypothetical protein
MTPDDADRPSTGADESESYADVAIEVIEALIRGVSNLPGVTLDARDGMGVRLHTTAQVKDWLYEEARIAAGLPASSGRPGASS